MVLSYSSQANLFTVNTNLPFKPLRGNSLFMLLESKKTGEITVIGQLRYIKILTCLRGLGNKTKENNYPSLNFDEISFVLIP